MGFALGALGWIMGLAYLARLLTRRITRSPTLGRWQFASSYLFAWALSIPVVAYGFADGGPTQWVFGVTAYLPAALLGFCATLVALRPQG